MAEKLIRDGLLTSKRIGAVSEFAELLFVRIVLASCPLGRFTADPARIRSDALSNRPRKRLTDIASALQEMQLAGLIVRYTAPDGTALMFIPRLGQRFKFAARSPWPPPPEIPDAPGQEVMRLGDAADPPVIHKPVEPTNQEREEKRRGEVKRAGRATPTPTAILNFSIEAIQGRWPGIEVRREAEAAQRKQRRKLGESYQLDLKWFEQYWLPAVGPKLAGEVKTSAGVAAEPEGWRIYLKDNFAGEDWAESAAACEWASVPKHWQRRIQDGMRGAA